MLAERLGKAYFKKKRTIQVDGKLISLERPLVMGILNLTSDSFYDGGRYDSLSKALLRADEIIAQGAAIIDVGASSTRPGAPEISSETELERLLPVVHEIKKRYKDIVVSIDTYRSEVALRVNQDCGPCMVNDISGGLFDAAMAGTVAYLQVPYVAMHIKGIPSTMQQNPEYANVTKEVIKHLSERVGHLHEAGVADVIVDPGFGFGKTLDHNYELFNHLDAFRFFELPLLVGVSRKSMIYRLFDGHPEDALNGSTALHALALKAGADILRVHDVREAVEVVQIFDKLKQFAQ